MADELKLRIVLDDGSVKEGFLSVEKQADKTAKKIGQSFDNKGAFNSLSKGAEEFSDTIQSANGGISSLASNIATKLGPAGVVAGAIAATTFAIGKMALAGEQVNAINTQFGKIAESAGLQVDSFKQSIIDATKGLIDDEDALQIATKGIIALGDEAKRLPQILDASRNVSKALGKDFKDTFESLSQFVEVGNVRALRQYGIVLDLDKAYEKAAKSIGLTAAQLTEQQKQTIRANELLDQVPKKFGAAAESVTPLKDALDRLKVSFSNTLENLQTGLANLITKAFIDKADKSNVALSRLKDQLKDVDAEIKSVNERIAEIKMDKFASKSVQAAAEISSLTLSLRGLAKEQALIQSQIAKRESVKPVDAAAGTGTESKPAALTLTSEQKRIIREGELKRLNELQAYVSQQDKIVLDAEIKRLQNITDLDSKLTAQKSINDQQLILLEQQKNTALAQIDQQFSTEKGFTEEQRVQARLALQQSYYAQEQALAEENARKIKEIEDNKNFLLLNSYIPVMEGMKLAAQDFANNAAQKFQELGKQAFATLGQGIGRAFQSYGAALKRGADASKAFEAAIGDTIAGVASQFGDLFIQTGLGKLALSYGSDPTGYALIAAGAALKLLVGASGAGGGASSSTDTGGGIAATPSTATEITPTQELQRQEPQTAVQVTIQGDVLDSDESGSRIVNLINTAFDKKGVVINQGVFA